MSKFFSLTALALFIFCASHAQVCIPDSVARFFLEQNDRVKLLVQANHYQDEMISNLMAESHSKDLIINSYKKDSASFRQIIKTKDDEISFNKQELTSVKKEIKRQKFIKIVSWIGGVGIIVLLAI